MQAHLCWPSSDLISKPKRDLNIYKGVGVLECREFVCQNVGELSEVLVNEPVLPTHIRLVLMTRNESVLGRRFTSWGTVGHCWGSDVTRDGRRLRLLVSRHGLLVSYYHPSINYLRWRYLSYMATLLRALALIRRIYTLGSFLRCRFKSLLFILCRKLTSWLATVPASLAVTRRRLSYYKDIVVSRKPRPSQPSCTRDYAPLASFPGPTTAASTLPVSSSSQLLQASISRASIRVLSPVARLS